MSIVALLATVGLAAGVSRFLRLSPVTAKLRNSLSERSRILAKLFSCPHCLCFWTGAACAALAARSWFEAFAMVLLGWRGGYHLNQLLDRLVRRGRSGPAGNACHVCGKARDRDFLDRRGLAFCSYRCWFDYLKGLGQQARQTERELFDAHGAPARPEVCDGTLAAVSPAQARELLDSDAGYVYLDVRTPEEFASGHPAGAVNVPLYLRGQDDLEPNPDFVQVVSSHMEYSAHLLVGCTIGARSRAAAEALAAAGFSQVRVVRSGFRTAHRLDGATAAEGWLELGLPTEYGAPEGQSYASLTPTTRREPKRE